MILNAQGMILRAVFCLDHINLPKWLLFWPARFHNRMLCLLSK